MGVGLPAFRGQDDPMRGEERRLLVSQVRAPYGKVKACAEDCLFHMKAVEESPEFVQLSGLVSECCVLTPESPSVGSEDWSKHQ